MKFKRLLIILLISFMSFNASFIHVKAEEEIELEVLVEASPYSGIDEEEVRWLLANRPSFYTLEEGDVYTSLNEVVETVKDNLVNRNEYFVINYQTTEKTLAADIYKKALEESDSPIEGDYLRWDIRLFSVSNSGSTKVGDIFNYIFTFNMEYYTSKAQEDELNVAVDALLDSFGFDEKTRVKEKIETIYDYICENITYDYVHSSSAEPGDDDYYYLKHTAYAALIDKTCVCQGYASLFYRLLKEEGVDCRVISGSVGLEGHAWNIVKYGNYYYLCDSTWDAGNDNKQYFMLGTDSFYGDGVHVPDSKLEKTYQIDYTSSAFLNAYPQHETDVLPYAVMYLAFDRPVHTEYIYPGNNVLDFDYEVEGYYQLGWLLDGEPYDFSEPVNDDLLLVGDYELIPEVDLSREGIYIYGLPENAVYSSKAITPVIDVYDNDLKLKQGTDYTVSFKNNVKVGTATVTIKGKGNYTGTFTKTFEIRSLSNADAIALSSKRNQVIVKDDVVSYDGNVKKPDVILYGFAGEELEIGKDYIVTYGPNVNKGKGTINIIGINGYKGVIVKAFKIAGMDISDAVVGNYDFPYHKSMANIDLDLSVKGQKLEVGKDYKVSVKGNSAKVSGINNCTGSFVVTINVETCDISTLSLEINDVVFKDKVNSWRTTIVVNDNGKKLSSKTDYLPPSITYDEDVMVKNTDEGEIWRYAGQAVSVKDIVPDGTRLRVSVIGNGNYAGKIEGTYRVMSKSLKSVKALVNAQAYSGKEIIPSKDDIVLNDNGYILSNDQYEIVSVSKNIKAGKASMVIRGLGEYSGKKTINFTIIKKNMLEGDEVLNEYGDIVDFRGQLFDNDLLIDGIIYHRVYEYSETVEEGVVIHQSRTIGKMAKGGIVEVYVSKGREPRGYLLDLDQLQSFYGTASIETTQANLKGYLDKQGFNNYSFVYESSPLSIGAIISVDVDGISNYEPGDYKLSIPIVITICNKQH